MRTSSHPGATDAELTPDRGRTEPGNGQAPPSSDGIDHTEGALSRVVTQYDGYRRPLAEIHHMECLEAAAGNEELPAVEGGGLSNEQDGRVVSALSLIHI